MQNAKSIKFHANVHRRGQVEETSVGCVCCLGLLLSRVQAVVCASGRGAASGFAICLRAATKVAASRSLANAHALAGSGGGALA